MKLIVRIANALLYRYDVPVRQHPPGHVGCIVCGAYAHGWLDCATEAAGYKTIRNAEADMVKLVALRDGYRGEAS